MSKRAHPEPSGSAIADDDGANTLTTSPKRLRLQRERLSDNTLTDVRMYTDALDVGAQSAATEPTGLELGAVAHEHLRRHHDHAWLLHRPQQSSQTRQAHASTTPSPVASSASVAPSEPADGAPPGPVDATVGTRAIAANDNANWNSNCNADTTATHPAPTVVAPPFESVHRSWDAFEQALKQYAQSTFQLYVIRTTTSVKRRNQRITANAASASASSGPAVRAAAAAAAVDANTLHDAQQQSPQSSSLQLIPESYQWYSKTLMCTHGWKDRQRGSGKRSLSGPRSTSCPAKMCVTLQHRSRNDKNRADNDDTNDDDSTSGWHVVLTRHVRTHNHQLSKELYVYYTENRRIYDSDLLAGNSNSNSTSNAVVLPVAASVLSNRSGLSHLLTHPPEAATDVAAGAGLGGTPPVPPSHANSDAIELAVSAPSVRSGISARYPLQKTHASWDAFHKYIVAYATQSHQSFRARSTISVAAENLRTVRFARKMGSRTTSDAEDDDSATAQQQQLAPTHERWFSKMLICSHGWRRKSRSKGANATALDAVDDSTASIDGSNSSTCPVMLLARLQRDAHGTWCVMICRHMLKHNHALDDDAATSIATNSAAVCLSALAPVPLVRPTTQSMREALRSPGTASSSAHHHATTTDHTMLQHVRTDLASTTPTPHAMADAHDVVMETTTSSATLVSRTLAQVHAEDSAASNDVVVVRVPKFQTVHASWDAFHAALQAYSDATLQLYRTRTTSSVHGRNQKIAALKRRGTGDNDDTDTDIDNNNARNAQQPTDARVIPAAAWQWYSKTFVCTHGWKERRRGTGKRTVQPYRSTACPVKLCATVQFVSAADDSHGTNDGSDDHDKRGGGAWRVVVTKHVVDHNHNVSHALHQHYSENRRICDPELLAIDTSSAAAVRKPVATASTPSSTTLSTTLQQHQQQQQRQRQPQHSVAVQPSDAPHDVASESSSLTPNNNASNDAAPAASERVASDAIRHSMHQHSQHQHQHQHHQYQHLQHLQHLQHQIYHHHPAHHHYSQQQQHAPSLLQPFALASSDAMSIGLSESMPPHAGRDNHTGMRDDATMLSAADASARVALMMHVGASSAPLLAYNGSSFPSIGGSSGSGSGSNGTTLHSLFTSASHHHHHHAQQQQAFVFQSHPYFALEQAALAGLASANAHTIAHFPVTTSLSTASNHHNVNHTGVMTTTVYAPLHLTLSAPCRVHGGTAAAAAAAGGMQYVRLLADTAAPSSMCTCLSHTPSAAPPARAQLQAPTSGNDDVSLLRSTATDVSATQQQQQQQQARTLVQHERTTATHDDDSSNEAADDELHVVDDRTDDAAVWRPSLPPAIVVLATNSAGGKLWRAPRLERLHASWDALHAHLDAYSVATFQLFRVRTTSSVGVRNARIVRQAAARREIVASATTTAAQTDMTLRTSMPATPTPTPTSMSTPTAPLLQLIPESFQWYSKTFVCTHGWKERRRGKGHRVSHRPRATECPAKLCVTLQRVLQDATQWCVVVTRQGLDHNHELSTSAYQQYSDVRRIKDSTLLERAEALWQTGVSRRKIFEFLKDHAPNALVMKDVHNLVQRWQDRQHSKGVVRASSDNGSSEGSRASESGGANAGGGENEPETERDEGGDDRDGGDAREAPCAVGKVSSDRLEQHVR